MEQLNPRLKSTSLNAVRFKRVWSSRDPEKVALAYTPNCRWRNRSEFVNGRQEIVPFLTCKWTRNWTTDRSKSFGLSPAIVSRCASPTSGDDSGNWFRSFGNENWQFDDDG